MSLRSVIPSRGEIDRELSVDRPWWQCSVRFNVAISQNVPVARMHEREREGVMMRWGLSLRSVRGGVSVTTRGVLRSGTLRSDDALRSAWLYGQRGIVPIAGFYLWQHAPEGHHQPYYIRLVSRPVFGIAALWERAEKDEGEVIEGCALFAVDANPLLAEIDNITEQMPVILHRQDYAAWLGWTVSQAQKLLQPYPQTQMVCHPVGPHVNHPDFDGPELIRAVSL